jgi:hypothetical protein
MKRVFCPLECELNTYLKERTEPIHEGKNHHTAHNEAEQLRKCEIAFGVPIVREGKTDGALKSVTGSWQSAEFYVNELGRMEIV